MQEEKPLDPEEQIDKESLKVPKKLREVAAWVHPEGRVMGYLFVRVHGPNGPGEESPLEVLNDEKPFVVMRRRDPDEIRFYNRASIVRVDYQQDEPEEVGDATLLQCRLQMMDGSILEGTVMKSLPPDQSRLFDFLNRPSERFIKLYLGAGRVSLVNKSYIIFVTAMEE